MCKLLGDDKQQKENLKPTKGDSSRVSHLVMKSQTTRLDRITERQRDTNYEGRAIRAENITLKINLNSWIDYLTTEHEPTMQTNRKADHEEAWNHANASLKSQSTSDEFG
jgi:hypothetical protein